MSQSKNAGPLLVYDNFGGENPIPTEFIAAMHRWETVQAIPNDVGADSLTGTLLQSKVETNRTNERVKHNIGKANGAVILTDYQTNEWKQQVAVERVMWPGLYSFNVSATTSTTAKDLGNGQSITEISSLGSVFNSHEKAFSVNQVIPPEFLNGIVTTKEVFRLAGTDPAPDFVGDGVHGDLTSEIKRLDEYTYEQTITSNDVTLPLIQKRRGVTTQFGGGLTTETRTFRAGAAVTTSISGGLVILENEFSDIAPGYGVAKIVQLEDEAWPVLHGTLIDESTGITFNYTKQVVAAGSTGGYDTDTNSFTEIQPIDKWRSLAVVTLVDTASLPETITYKITFDVKERDFYTSADFIAEAGPVYSHSRSYGRHAGLSGPKVCNASESYLTKAQLLTFAPGTGRRISSGNSDADGDSYASTGGSGNYANTWAFNTPTDDRIEGDVLSVRVDKLRFGIFRVMVVTDPG